MCAAFFIFYFFFNVMVKEGPTSLTANIKGTLHTKQNKKRTQTTSAYREVQSDYNIRLEFNLILDLNAACICRSVSDLPFSMIILSLILRSRSATQFSDCVATIQGRWLIEGGVYSKKYGNSNHLLVYLWMLLVVLSCSYPKDKTCIHQQASFHRLHQLHNPHPSFPYFPIYSAFP